MKNKTRKVPFKIYLPATAEKEAEYVKTIKVDVYEKYGEDFVTLESRELIEKETARAMGTLHGSEIKALRKRLNLTQDQLSNLIGCGKKTLSPWENGRAFPTSTYNKFLRLLEEGYVTPAQLKAIQGPRKEEHVTSNYYKRPNNIVRYNFNQIQPTKEAVEALLDTQKIS